MTDSEVIDAILHIIRDRERYAVAFRKEATFRIEAYTTASARSASASWPSLPCRMSPKA